MTVIAARLLPCPDWCDSDHAHDDVRGNGWRFHLADVAVSVSGGTDQHIWSDGYRLEAQFVRYDDHESGPAPTAEIRLRIDGPLGVDCTPEMLDAFAAWFAERADELRRINAEH